MDLKNLPPQLFYVAAGAFWVTAFLTYGTSQTEGTLWLVLGVAMFLFGSDRGKKNK